MRKWIIASLSLIGGTAAFCTVDPSSNTVPNGYNIGMAYKVSTPSGKTEIKTLYDASYQGVTSTSTTPFTAYGDNNAQIFLYGEFNHDGRPDCYFIKKNGTTATEVRILDGAQNYATNAASYNGLSANIQTVLGPTGTNHLWEFLLGDYNGDGVLDIYAIKRLDTNTNLLIRVLDGANNFGSYLAVSTNMPGLSSGYLTYQFALGHYDTNGIPDLYLIEQSGASGKVEVDVISGLTGYTSWVPGATNIETALSSTGANRSNDFMIADYDGDYIPDLYQIKRDAPSGKVEVHILSGADGFQTWLCHGTTTVASVGANDAVGINIMPGLQSNYTVPVYTVTNSIINYNTLTNAVQIGIRRGIPLSIKTPFLPTNNPFMWHAIQLPVWMTVYGSNTYVSMLTNSAFSTWQASSVTYSPPVFGNAATYDGTGGLRQYHATGWYSKVWGLYGGGSVTSSNDAYGTFAHWVATSVTPPSYTNCPDPEHATLHSNEWGYCSQYDSAIGRWVRLGTAGHDFGQIIPVPSFVKGWVTARIRLRVNGGSTNFFMRIYQGYGNDLHFNVSDSRTLPALAVPADDHETRDYLICYNLDDQYTETLKMDGTGRVKYLGIVFTSATPTINHDIDIYYIGLTPGIGAKDALDPCDFMEH